MLIPLGKQGESQKFTLVDKDRNGEVGFVVQIQCMFSFVKRSWKTCCTLLSPPNKLNLVDSFLVFLEELLTSLPRDD